MLKRIIVYPLLALLVSCALVPMEAAGDAGAYLLQERANQVVMLTGPSNHARGGTGFQVQAPSGITYTVTNAHICEIAENGEMAAKVPGAERWIRLRVREVAEHTDLCLLDSLPASRGIKLAKKQGEKQRLWVLGHPLLKPLSLASGFLVVREEITIGQVVEDPSQCKKSNQTVESVLDPFSGMPINYCLTAIDGYDTTIPIFPGNSGSPVMNSDGDVVGVAFAGDSRTNYGAIIPLDVLKSFLSVY
jgi:hypothetical protein